MQIFISLTLILTFLSSNPNKPFHHSEIKTNIIITASALFSQYFPGQSLDFKNGRSANEQISSQSSIDYHQGFPDIKHFSNCGKRHQKENLPGTTDGPALSGIITDISTEYLKIKNENSFTLFRYNLVQISIMSQCICQRFRHCSGLELYLQLKGHSPPT